MHGLSDPSCREAEENGPDEADGPGGRVPPAEDGGDAPNFPRPHEGRVMDNPLPGSTSGVLQIFSSRDDGGPGCRKHRPACERRGAKGVVQRRVAMSAMLNGGRGLRKGVVQKNPHRTKPTTAQTPHPHTRAPTVSPVPNAVTAIRSCRSCACKLLVSGSFPMPRLTHAA